MNPQITQILQIGKSVETSILREEDRHANRAQGI
jgi:hypothetical protein